MVKEVVRYGHLSVDLRSKRGRDADHAKGFTKEQTSIRKNEIKD